MKMWYFIFYCWRAEHCDEEWEFLTITVSTQNLYTLHWCMISDYSQGIFNFYSDTEIILQVEIKFLLILQSSIKTVLEKRKKKWAANKWTRSVVQLFILVKFRKASQCVTINKLPQAQFKILSSINSRLWWCKANFQST